MTQKRQRSIEARRDFLRHGLAVTAGALLAPLAGDAVAAPALDAAPGATSNAPTGYRETAHVRRYYETTRN